jgi:hypothetical protein
MDGKGWIKQFDVFANRIAMISETKNLTGEDNFSGAVKCVLMLRQLEKRFRVLKRMAKYSVLYVAYMTNPSIVSCFMSMQRQSL